MWLNSRRVYPVPTSGGACSRRRRRRLADRAAWALDAPLAVAVALVLAYPLVLLPLGFYLPAERARLRRLVTSRA